MTPFDNPCIIPFTFTPSGPGPQTATVTFGSTNGSPGPAMDPFSAEPVAPQTTNSVTLNGSTPAEEEVQEGLQAEEGQGQEEVR